MAQTNASTSVKNIVLVQGAFVDGSTWRGVYDPLKQDCYNVAVKQNPTLSLEGSTAATRRVIDAQDGPVVLVGHSYGRAVITKRKKLEGNTITLSLHGCDKPSGDLERTGGAHQVQAGHVHATGRNGRF
jgi:hypothetical protein